MAFLRRLARESFLLRRLSHSPPPQPPPFCFSGCRNLSQDGGTEEAASSAFRCCATRPKILGPYRFVTENDLSISFLSKAMVDTNHRANPTSIVKAIRSFKGTNISQVYTKINKRGVQDPSYRYLWTRSLNTQNGSNKPEASVDSRRQMLNRLLYRSRQRGYLELDLILGKWTEENIEKLDEQQLKSLVEVLDLENPELWKWLTGQETAPESLKENPVFAEIHKKILEDLRSHSPSETRAKLGQPWVRGWDDNRKVGGPQAGNQ